MVTTFVERVARLALGYAALVALFAVPVLTARALVAQPGASTFAAGLVVAVLLAAFAWRWRFLALRVAGDAFERVGRIDERRFVIGAVALGLVLRLGWAACFHGVPNSDGVTYLELARKLFAGEPYATGGTLAYWPPGYPLYMAPWLGFIGSERLAIIASNVPVFVLGALGVHSLAKRVAGPACAQVALLLFCLWPNLVTQGGMPEKEQLLAALLPWVLRNAIPDDRGIALLRALLGGAALGAMALVQPAFQFFLVALVPYWLLCAKPWRHTPACGVLVVVGMVAAVSPWTYRNYQVFHKLVPVATNAGLGLYGANNPRANGGYYEHWADEAVMRLPELEADRRARELAFEWIAARPGDFAALAFEKNLRLMGDDATGAYQTLKRGQGTQSNAVYFAFKSLSNLWWLAYWASMLAVLMAAASLRSSTPSRPHAETVLVSFAFLYTFFLHAIGESAGKYHVATLGILAVLLPMLAWRALQASHDPRPSPTATER